MKKWIIKYQIDGRIGLGSRKYERLGSVKAETPKKALEKYLEQNVDKESDMAEIVGNDAQPVGDTGFVVEPNDIRKHIFEAIWDNHENEVKVK